MSKLFPKVFRIAMGSFAAAMLAVSLGCSQTAETSASNSPADSPSEASVAANVDQPNVENQSDSDTDDTADAANQYRTVENATLPAPGSDPLEMIFEMRQPDGEAIGSEQIRVSYPTVDQAVVVWVQRGLLDDSVSAMRTRYEFEAIESPDGQQLWQVVNVTQQNKCHSGRGSQDWTGALCN
jgi:hypothetical protein